MVQDMPILVAKMRHIYQGRWIIRQKPHAAALGQWAQALAQAQDRQGAQHPQGINNSSEGLLIQRSRHEQVTYPISR